MITFQDVKNGLNDPNLDETETNLMIVLVNEGLKKYTNNQNLMDDDKALDVIRLKLVCSYMNRDLKGTQGMNSRGVGGFNVSIGESLSGFEKQILAGYTRLGMM